MWKVRPTQVGDIIAIEGLLVSADGDRESLAEDRFVVAEDEDGSILGCGRLRPYPDFCELAGIAVAHEARAGLRAGRLSPARWSGTGDPST